jgi:hypothetical protein
MANLTMKIVCPHGMECNKIYVLKKVLQAAKLSAKKNKDTKGSHVFIAIKPGHFIVRALFSYVVQTE